MSRRVTSSVVDVIDSEANLRIIDPSGWLHLFFSGVVHATLWKLVT